MSIKEYLKSSNFKGILVGLCLAIVILIIFETGVAFGYHRANFRNHFGDNFNKNFVEPQFREFPNNMMKPSSFSFNCIGPILAINGEKIIVSDQDKLEKTVIINKETRIREFQSEIKPADLRVGDQIIIIGQPNSKAEIEARLIRRLPSPPTQIKN